MQLRSVDATMYVFRGELKFFFAPENMKKTPSKVAYNQPRSFFSAANWP